MVRGVRGETVARHLHVSLVDAWRGKDLRAARRARTLGLALRLGETLCGGAPGTLGRFALEPAPRRGLLNLRCRPGDRGLVGEVVMRRFKALAARMELAPRLRVRGE